ncbi:peptidoglycan-binding protein [Curtobacterium sp. ODYSSEY 48 V2]|uniref:efflux RND transporter periplasmic adaptor subunit n=1 Tax=unclassified Curtobacterium TaxID=257496 RepID=UPI00203E50F9|nr:MULTISPECIES: peptidoglycan-binding protein [unclassified Curtobacterium]MCM3503536.1 peptidoglycan-binding protein [Curtobacterium sp. ODYSSEY 48 V2]MDB6428482.1 peptidoglycan-binding protein [Curtobacterium sp. 20TX0008]
MTPAAKRATIASACLAAVLAAGVGTWAVVGGTTTESSAAETRQQHVTAPVTKGDLTDSKVFAGTLGYGASTGVPGAAAGTVTWLPEPGQVIEQDQPLYAVDERPVRAMYGSTPLWRSLEYGQRGADVRQLNEDLAALGYDVAVDDRFGRRTLAAVQRWQKDRGLTVTGTVTKDDIVFVDGPVRVDSIAAKLGQPVGGDVLEVTSTKRVVNASVPQANAQRLAVGTKVRIRINGSGDPIDGEVVDAEAAQSDTGGKSVDATIAFDAGDREVPAAATVQVEAPGQTERDVLSVPVQALTATGRSGEYAVDVARRDGTTKRVAVTVGLVADGRAAVTGDLHEGDEVVVPS